MNFKFKEGDVIISYNNFTLGLVLDVRTYNKAFGEGDYQIFWIFTSNSYWQTQEYIENNYKYLCGSNKEI